MIDPGTAVTLISALAVITALIFLAVAIWRRNKRIGRLKKELERLEHEAEIREDILRRQSDDNE